MVPEHRPGGLRPVLCRNPRVAEVLDYSLPALKSLLFRAHETLRHRLAHFAA